MPWLRDGDAFECYLEYCLSHLKNQDLDVKILSPFLTQPTHEKITYDTVLRLITEKLNELIEEFNRSDASHALLINADIELPRYGLRKLLTLDVDLASGVYPLHQNTDETMAGLLNDDRFHRLRRDEIEGRILGERERVANGDGCLLIKRRLILQHHPAYRPLRFRYGHIDYGSDLLFWKYAQDMGFSARLHGGVMCGHLPQHPLKSEILNKPLITV